mmetsp:Transcript_49669/g.164533  ORF Transcript_49669/g.164533 Transcript_49669/m.164533 type:complete len:356 (+) Transcript_49669:947-2014(+)
MPPERAPESDDGPGAPQPASATESAASRLPLGCLSAKTSHRQRLFLRALSSVLCDPPKVAAENGADAGPAAAAAAGRRRVWRRGGGGRARARRAEAGAEARARARAAAGEQGREAVQDDARRGARRLRENRTRAGGAELDRDVVRLSALQPGGRPRFGLWGRRLVQRLRPRPLQVGRRRRVDLPANGHQGGRVGGRGASRGGCAQGGALQGGGPRLRGGARAGGGRRAFGPARVCAGGRRGGPVWAGRAAERGQAGPRDARPDRRGLRHGRGRGGGHGRLWALAHQLRVGQRAELATPVRAVASALCGACDAAARRHSAHSAFGRECLPAEYTLVFSLAAGVCASLFPLRTVVCM